MAILIVEKKPKRFKIDAAEVSNRREFINRTRTLVKVSFVSVFKYKYDYTLSLSHLLSIGFLNYTVNSLCYAMLC